MKLAIMQPYFLPYIGYWQLLSAVDKFVIYDDVNFINRGWINRNQLLVQGKSSMFTIPLVESSQNKKINEIEIVDSVLWKHKLLKTIRYNYAKAPYFEVVNRLMEQIILFNEFNLSRYISNSLDQIVNYLGFKVEIVFSSNLYNNQEFSGAERILDICKQEGATVYINPMGGHALYDKKDFMSQGIDLKFLRTNTLNYLQQQTQGTSFQFVPNLSILDILMNVEKSEIKEILNQFELT